MFRPWTTRLCMRLAVWFSCRPLSQEHPPHRLPGDTMAEPSGSAEPQCQVCSRGLAGSDPYEYEGRLLCRRCYEANVPSWKREATDCRPGAGEAVSSQDAEPHTRSLLHLEQHSSTPERSWRVRKLVAGCLVLMVAVASAGTADRHGRFKFALVVFGSLLGAGANVLRRQRAGLHLSWLNAANGAWLGAVVVPTLLVLVGGSGDLAGEMAGFAVVCGLFVSVGLGLMLSVTGQLPDPPSSDSAAWRNRWRRLKSAITKSSITP